MVDTTKSLDRFRKPNYRETPVLSALAGAAFVNWFIFAAISLKIGGVAIGTQPSKDGFVVTEHGSKTAVTERIWVISLIYPYLTFTVTPVVFIACAVRHLRRFIPHPMRWVVLVFLCVWVVGWYYAVNRDALGSLLDYLAFKRH